MTIKHELRSCPRCGELRTVAVRRPNHVIHAVMTVLTAGFWLPVWALAGLESLFHRATDGEGSGRCPGLC